MTEHETEKTTEEIDRQTRYRLYEKAYEKDSDLITQNSSDFNNAIRYFTGTLLVILFTAVNTDASNSSFFKAVIILCVITIVSNLLAHPFTQYSAKKHRDVYGDLYFLQDDHSYRFKQHWTHTGSFILECISTVSFILVAYLLTHGFISKDIIIKGVSQ